MSWKTYRNNSLDWTQVHNQPERTLKTAEAQV